MNNVEYRSSSLLKVCDRVVRMPVELTIAGAEGLKAIAAAKKRFSSSQAGCGKCNCDGTETPTWPPRMQHRHKLTWKK